MNTPKWAYEYSNSELIEAFAAVAAEVGISGSGLVIDLAGGPHFGGFSYLKGVLLARLDGAQPPLKPGQEVRLREESLSGPDRWMFLDDMRKQKFLTVTRIHYRGRWQNAERWELEFKGIESPENRSGFPHTNFEEIPKEQSIPA